MQKPEQGRLVRAYRSVSCGVPVAEHARRWNLSSMELAWKHYNLAAPLVRNLRAHGKAIVSDDVWHVLESMRRDPRLGGRLSALHPVVSRRVGRAVDMNELRFARTCVLWDQFFGTVYNQRRRTADSATPTSHRRHSAPP